MAVQVVTNENMVEFIQTGKVPEFKPPEPAQAAPKSDAEPPAKPAVERAPDGKFTKAEKPDTNAPTAPNAGKEDHEVEDADLPERAQKRIGQKHRLWKEAQEETARERNLRQAAEKRAEEAERKLNTSNPKSDPVQTEALTAPKPEDFKTVAEYADALVDYKLAKRVADEAKQRQADEKAAREREFVKRLNVVKAKHDDFVEVVSRLSDSGADSVPVDVVEYLQESEVGPDLMYHLAKHPDTLDRLRKLSPRRFIAELGKLEDKLTAPPAREPDPKEPEPTLPPTAKVSKAPAPIAPLDAAGTSPVSKDPSQMSVQELREYRRLEQLKRRR